MRDVYSHGVREFGVMRYVPTGRHDDRYGIPVTVTMPLIERIDALVREECPGMSVAWPCAQKLCTSDTDSPLRSDDPTLGLRMSQIVGHCESGIVWGSVSFDGKLRNCPHSNAYFGALVQQPLAQAWPTLTDAVHTAVETRPSCAGCAVAVDRHQHRAHVRRGEPGRTLGGDEVAVGEHHLIHARAAAVVEDVHRVRVQQRLPDAVAHHEAAAFGALVMVGSTFQTL